MQKVARKRLWGIAMANFSLWSFTNIGSFVHLFNRTDKLRAYIYTEQGRKVVTSLSRMQSYCQENLAFEIVGKINEVPFQLTAMPYDFPWSAPIWGEAVSIGQNKGRKRNWLAAARSFRAFDSSETRYKIRQPATLTFWTDKLSMPEFVEWSQSLFLCPEDLIVRGSITSGTLYINTALAVAPNQWLFPDLEHSWPHACDYYIVSTACKDAENFKDKAVWYEEEGRLLYFKADPELMLASILKIRQYSQWENKRFLNKYYPE